MSHELKNRMLSDAARSALRKAIEAVLKTAPIVGFPESPLGPLSAEEVRHWVGRDILAAVEKVGDGLEGDFFWEFDFDPEEMEEEGDGP